MVNHHLRLALKADGVRSGSCSRVVPVLCRSLGRVGVYRGVIKIHPSPGFREEKDDPRRRAMLSWASESVSAEGGKWGSFSRPWMELLTVPKSGLRGGYPFNALCPI